MRILMLGVKEYPYGVSATFEKFPGGGTAKYVIALSEGLAENNYTVDLIVRKMPGQKKFWVDKGINIHRVSWINNRYLRLPSFNFFAFLKALSFIKKVDVIHTHGSFAAIFGVILGRLYGKKVIGTTHGLTSDQAKYKYNKLAVKLTKWVERWGYSRLDLITFLSQAEKDLVITSLKFKPKSSAIVFPGIKPLIIKRKKSTKFKVVFVGRLVPMKGLDKFIDSFRLLPPNVQKKTEYIIVGDGYYRKKLEEQVRKLKLESKIKFTGYTNNIEQYLSDASLFILPSEGGEGLPCALLEAMSAGIACMVSNFDAPMGKRSIIILINNDSKTIANQIINMFSNKIMLSELGKNAKEEFFVKFSIKSVVGNYETIYGELNGLPK